MIDKSYHMKELEAFEKLKLDDKEQQLKKIVKELRNSNKIA